MNRHEVGLLNCRRADTGREEGHITTNVPCPELVPLLELRDSSQAIPHTFRDFQEVETFLNPNLKHLKKQ
jgi:hypothetical protein